MYVVGIKRAMMGACPIGHLHKRKRVELVVADLRVGTETNESVMCPTCLKNVVQNLLHHPVYSHLAKDSAEVSPETEDVAF